MHGDGDGRGQWCDGHGVTGHGLLCTLSTVRLSLRLFLSRYQILLCILHSMHSSFDRPIDLKMILAS